jgi:hypothetical protein
MEKNKEDFYSIKELLQLLKGELKASVNTEYKKTVKEIWSMIGRNDSDLENFLEGKTVKEFISENPYSSL